MPVSKRLRIRLSRGGFRNLPYYFMDLVEAHKKRDCMPIERLGEFNAIPQAGGIKVIQLKFERIKYWLAAGAEPSETVRKLLGKASILPSVPRGLHANAELTDREKEIAAESKEKIRIECEVPKDLSAFEQRIKRGERKWESFKPTFESDANKA